MTIDLLNKKFYNTVRASSATIVIGFFDEVNDKYYLQQNNESLVTLMKRIINEENIDVNNRELIDAIEQDTWFKYKIAVCKDGKIYQSGHLASLVNQILNMPPQNEEAQIDE